MLLMALVAAVTATQPHVLASAFGVPIGEPAGDLRAKGWKLEDTLIWSRGGDGFFDEIKLWTARRDIVMTIAAHKLYEGDKFKDRRAACRAGYDALLATLRAKYPSLVALPKDGNAGSGSIHVYASVALQEPITTQRPSAFARTVHVACSGPSGDSERFDTEAHQLNILYRLGDGEDEAGNAKQDRERGRRQGLKPDNL